MHRFLLAAAFLALGAAAAQAQTGATGNWSGTYTFTVQLKSCGGQTFSANGDASLTLLQTAGSVSGRLDLTHFLHFTNQCTATTAELTRVVVGSANGSSIAFTFPNDTSEPRFTGSIGATTMNVQWTDDMGASASLALTRTAGDDPSVDMTGAWIGKYDFADQCSQTRSAKYSGAFTLALTQSGSNAGGVVTMHNLPLYKLDCTEVMSLDATLAAAGTVSGTTFTGDVFDPSGSFSFPITAQISATSIDGKVAGASLTHTSGTFSLASSTVVTPSSDVGGTYEGTYTETDDLTASCLNGSSMTYSGAASLTIEQAGNDVSGWLTLRDKQVARPNLSSVCSVVQVGDVVLPVYGAIDKNVVTVRIPSGASANVYTFTFDGNAMKADLVDPIGDIASATLSRTQSGPKRRSVHR